jgi:hypothetical protein
VLLLTDLYGNVELFRLLNNKIIRYHFNRRNKRQAEMTIAMDVNLEYDVCIDEENTIYLAYQDINYNIIFATIRNDKINRIELTNSPSREAYYMNMTVHDGEVHIFYFAPEEGMEKYKLYHHHLKNKDWTLEIVDEIRVRELLDPLCIHKAKDRIIAAFLDYNLEGEQVYIKTFNMQDGKWEERIKLTDSPNNKLYLDLIYKDDKIHLTYCQYEEENLLIKYERFNYEDGNISKETEEVISNLGSQQDPTLIYYYDRLWISWIEHEKVYSRFSADHGNNWSPIYLWKESAKTGIVRYKYSNWDEDEEVIILNYSFGKIKDDIKFIGFGALQDVEEVPLKKNYPSDLLNSPQAEEVIVQGDEFIKKIELIDELNRKIIELENNLRALTERIEYIEEFLSRRSRRFFR